MKAELTKKFFERWPFFFRPNGNIQETLIPFGFECGDGWFKLLWELCEGLEEIIIKNKKMHPSEELCYDGLDVVQVKEKYATLRFYMHGGTDEMDDLVNKAERKSGKICEECGKRGRLHSSGCWIKTLCKLCTEKLRKEGYSYFRIRHKGKRRRYKSSVRQNLDQ